MVSGDTNWPTSYHSLVDGLQTYGFPSRRNSSQKLSKIRDTSLQPRTCRISWCLPKLSGSTWTWSLVSWHWNCWQPFSYISGSSEPKSEPLAGAEVDWDLGSPDGEGRHLLINVLTLIAWHEWINSIASKLNILLNWNEELLMNVHKIIIQFLEELSVSLYSLTP